MNRKPTKILISKLRLDKCNYRLPPMDGKSEEFIVNSLIDSDAKHYLGLYRSILGKGYLWRECLLVLENADGTYTVVEGNRRASILRLIHGKIKAESTKLTKKDLRLLEEKGGAVKDETRKIFCIVYKESERDEAYAELAPIHSNNDASARQVWTSLAKARYERSRTQKENIVLQLFEKFLEALAENSPEDVNYQKWQYSYPLDALKEAIQRLAEYYGVSDVELVNSYEDEAVKPTVDAFIMYIGKTTDVYRKIRAIGPFTENGCSSALGIALPTKECCEALRQRIAASSTVTDVPGSSEETSTETPGKETGGKKPPRAKSIPASNTHKSIVTQLNTLHFTNERYLKLLTLHRELVELARHDLPNVFAIALRSFLDIASVIYCDHHNCSSGGKLPLKSRISAAIDHIKNHAPGWKDSQQAKKLLDTARTYLTQKTLLSIDFLHEIVHNKDNSFTITNETIAGNLSKIIPLMLALTENEPPK